MRIDKDKLRDEITKVIGDGVVEMEEIDITAQKVIDVIWPIILHLHDEAVRLDELIKSIERTM